MAGRIEIDGVAVTLDPADESGRRKVRLDGREIGRVWKSTRRYGPPTHKGSRIVRFHKDVPCWRNDAAPYRVTFDTRKDAIRYLLREGGVS